MIPMVLLIKTLGDIIIPNISKWRTNMMLSMIFVNWVFINEHILSNDKLNVRGWMYNGLRTYLN